MAEPEIDRESPTGRLLAAAEARVRDACEDAGWEVKDVQPGEGAFGLRLRRGGLAYLLVGRVSREARRDQLQGQLADSWLRARALAVRGERPLAALVVPVLSPAMASALAEYAKRYAPHEAYLVLDASGRAEIKAPGLEKLDLELEAPAVKAPVGRAPLDLFTDLNQWILKVLLAPRFPAAALAAPRGPYGTATALARAAEVSIPVATRLVAALREAGFLEDRRGLALARIPELLERWRAAAARPVGELHARPVLAPANPRKKLREAVLAYVGRRADVEDPGEQAQPWSGARFAPLGRLCFGLFAGAASHGLGHVSGVPDHLLVERIDEPLLEELGLRKSDLGEPFEVVLRRPRYPEATFRAAVVHDGLPTADVLQCWLDLTGHPARGAEQAELIWRRAIGPKISGER